MECLKTSSIRKLDPEWSLTIHCKVPSGRFWLQKNLPFPHPGSSDYLGLYKPLRLINHVHRYWRHSSFKALAVPVHLDEEPLTSSPGLQMSHNNELDSKDDVFSQKPESDEGEQMSHNNNLYSKDENVISQKLESAELKSLLADSERGKLLRKLSEANQYNRFFRRQLLNKDQALVNFKSELAFLELELQALVSLAEEIANFSTPIVSRKINGKYITSHLLSRLQAIQKKVKEHVKDIDSVKVKDTVLFLCGVAESVRVMGSFDGWTQGEEMSPEYTGSVTKFSVTMRLIPGRYEIKFLVDGEWQFSPELPTVGEGMMRNNLLIVE